MTGHMFVIKTGSKLAFKMHKNLFLEWSVTQQTDGCYTVTTSETSLMKNCFDTVESLIGFKLVNENSIKFPGKFHVGRLFPLKFHYLKLNT